VAMANGGLPIGHCKVKEHVQSLEHESLLTTRKTGLNTMNFH